jgi:hypothetical protein
VPEFAAEINLAGGVGTLYRFRQCLVKAAGAAPASQLRQLEARGADMGLGMAAGDLDQLGELGGQHQLRETPPVAGRQRVADMVAHHDEGLFETSPGSVQSK